MTLMRSHLGNPTLLAPEMQARRTSVGVPNGSRDTTPQIDSERTSMSQPSAQQHPARPGRLAAIGDQAASLY